MNYNETKKIEKISNFILSEHTNNLYKKEAGSSLALAKDVAAKLNEVIDSFNELAKNKWEKIHEQDGKIRKAILYMKDNLLNAINSLLNTKGEEMMDNAVKEYLGTLQAQLNNLLGAVTTGSTTLDAELIDLRVGPDGTTYKTAGESFRNELQKRTCYTGVMVSGSINSEYVVKDHVRLTAEKIHVFYNGYRYDVLNVDTSLNLTDAHELFNILFDLTNKTIHLALSTEKIPSNCVMIGCVFKDKIKFNEYSFSNNYYADSIKPLLANAWTDIHPHFIKVDTNNFKLVLNANLVIFYNGKGILINKGEFNLPVTSNTTLFYLVYDPNNATIELLPWGNDFPLNKIAFGLLNTYQGVHLFGINKKQEKNLGVLLASISENYIEFDGVNKIITFPNDTLILSNLPNYYYQLSTAKNNNVISYANQTSSALCIYYNIVTDSLEILKYSDVATQNLILLATFRTSTGIVSTSLPWKWNGKPYNMNLSNEIEIIPENIHVKSINHRGYVSAPENTLSAYKLSAKNGFKYVECDVSFTSDNVPVLLHDDTIDRTSNGSGNVADLTYAQLLTYDFGSWKSLSYTGEKIPTFEQFISLCKKLGLHPYIELKTGTQTQINNLVSIVKRYGMIDNVSWISFDSALLSYVVAVHSKARLGVCTNAVTSSLIETIKTLKKDNEVFIDCLYTAVTSDSINLCINNDIPLEVWTINDESALLNLNPYITGVSSDNLHTGKILYSKV